jgi:hypothetical protein
MSRVPMACSLDASRIADRRETFRALAARALLRAVRLASGLLFEFRDQDGTVEPAIRTLARAEKACCPFFDLSVTGDGRGRQGLKDRRPEQPRRPRRSAPPR